VRLRDLARAESATGESRIDFALRFGGRRPTGDEEWDVDDDAALMATKPPMPEDE
jgi:hypothetical protein